MLGRCAATTFAIFLSLVGAHAKADMSGCQSAYSTQDQHQKIFLYTICINSAHEGPDVQASAYTLRGLAYTAIGDLDKALQDYDAAIADGGGTGAAYGLRGEIYANRGEFTKAMSDFEVVAHSRFGANSASGLASKAWLLATSPNESARNGKEAVELALKAVKLRDNPDHRDVLAAAFAEAGQFDDAVREETKAIEGLKPGKKPEDRSDYLSRLALYQNRVTYHTSVPFARLSKASD